MSLQSAESAFSASVPKAGPGIRKGLRMLLLPVSCLLFWVPGSAFAYIESPYAATFQSIRLPHLPRGDEPWVQGDWQIVIAASLSVNNLGFVQHVVLATVRFGVF